MCSVEKEKLLVHVHICVFINAYSYVCVCVRFYPLCVLCGEGRVGVYVHTYVSTDAYFMYLCVCMYLSVCMYVCV